MRRNTQTDVKTLARGTPSGEYRFTARSEDKSLLKADLKEGL